MGGQSQRLYDVGMYRYAASNSRPSIIKDMVGNVSAQAQNVMESFRSSPELTPQNYEQRPVEQPSLTTGIVSNMSQQMQEAMEYLNVDACRNPMSVADDWEIDCEPDVIDGSEQAPPVTVHGKDNRTPDHFPNLLQPAQTDVPPLSSLPAKAYGLTRPQGFPEFETTSRATLAF